MNATRFPLPPLPQPEYRFDEIPAAARNLEGSTLSRVDDRAVWQASLGEMILVCKEAVRRQKQKQQQLQQQEEENGEATTTSSTAPLPTSHTSKPLSLEFLADRSDIDDPLWGYMVRCPQGRLQGFITVTTFTNYHKSFRWDSLHPAAFDDEHDDDDDGTRHTSDKDSAMTSPQRRKHHHHPQRQSRRVVDSNGRLAQELQATVRAGDIWNEGIVWPRIAEISLLGGLGCGKTLLSLVLEDLAHAKPSPLQHYDYVVLQATDNSISFYESMGFCRVGALTTESSAAAGLASPRRHRHGQGDRNDDNDDDGNNRNTKNATMHGVDLTQDWGSPMASKTKQKSSQSNNNDDDADPPSSDWVEGPATEKYTTKKAGETPLKIAQSLRVNVYDIVFLNLRHYPDLTPTSRLKAQTVLTVPKVLPKETARQRPQVEIQWYTAKENDTPRSIAKMFAVPCAQIVAANKMRLPGLLSSSRLKQGTKVRISKQDGDGLGCVWQAYAHWAFPDDDFEEGEPSYMMALKLDKPSKSTATAPRQRPVLDSLAIEISEYQRPKLLRDVVPPAAAATPKVKTPAPLPPPPQQEQQSPPQSTRESNKESLQTLVASFPPPPVPPKRPPAAFLLFCHDMRQRKAALLAGKNAGQAARILKDAYELTADAEKQAYIDRAAAMRSEFQTAKAAFQQEMDAYQKAYPQAVAAQAALAAATTTTAPSTPLASSKTKVNSMSGMDTTMAVAPTPAKADLFNKVVRLREGAPLADGGSFMRNYTYWYVLTYIPDLQWCHLAPMVTVGTFGPDKPRAEGRPKYKLEDESLGLEVDISSTFCIPVKSRSMRKTMDADKEEWDVRDDGTVPGSRRSSLDGSASASSFRSATKPSVIVKDRKRKRPLIDHGTAVSEASPATVLEAIRPDTQQRIRVMVRQRGPGRPPKSPMVVAPPPPQPVTMNRRTSTSSTTTNTAMTDEENFDVSAQCSSNNSCCSDRGVERKRNHNSTSNNNRGGGGTPRRPKRLSAPLFMGESPLASPRVRQQSVRGRNPAKY